MANKNTLDLELVRPNHKLFADCLAYKREFQLVNSSMDGAGALKETDDETEFFAMTERELHPETLPQGRVTADLFCLVKKGDKRVLGMCQVRRYLNEYLLRCGGNIGYSVRPSERRKGYAKIMLRLALDYCKSIGMQVALVTCNADNIGSEKTILSVGGVQENEIWDAENNCYIKRFWIEIN